MLLDRLPIDAPGAQAARAQAEALRRQFISRAEMMAAADWLERGQPEDGRVGQGTGHRRALAADDEDTDDTEVSQ